MLKKSKRVSFGWAGVLLGVGVALATACGDTGNNGGICAPNEQKACQCTGGLEGFQTCSNEGSEYSPCDCSGASGSSGAAGFSGSSGSGGSTIPTGACGDGVPDPGECTGGENACPEDCPMTGGSGGTGGDPCAGAVTFASPPVPSIPSQWGASPLANGKTGYEAGIEICKTIGADHPCDYEELLVAEAAGELAMVPQGTAAWVHRTTDAMVNGTLSPAGPGGRCNDWTYTTNHISDGEFVTFDMVGIPSYHLDNDTFYDGVDTTHTVAGQMQCGSESRAILCCFPSCMAP